MQLQVPPDQNEVQRDFDLSVKYLINAAFSWFLTLTEHSDHLGIF